MPYSTCPSAFWLVVQLTLALVLVTDEVDTPLMVNPRVVVVEVVVLVEALVEVVVLVEALVEVVVLVEALVEEVVLLVVVGKRVVVLVVVGAFVVGGRIGADVVVVANVVVVASSVVVMTVVVAEGLICTTVVPDTMAQISAEYPLSTRLVSYDLIAIYHVPSARPGIV